MKIKKGVAKRGPKKRKLADLKAQQQRFVTQGVFDEAKNIAQERESRIGQVAGIILGRAEYSGNKKLAEVGHSIASGKELSFLEKNKLTLPHAVYLLSSGRGFGKSVYRLVKKIN